MTAADALRSLSGLANGRYIAALVCFQLLVSAASPASAEVRPRLTHIAYDANDRRFEFFPITNYVNTAFDTAQVSLAFDQSGYWRNHKRVFDRILDPHDNIVDDGGYDKLVTQEFFSSRVLPNITLHFLGNGYDFRILAEWFDEHNAPYPFVWAFFTSYAGYIGNEAIEVSNPEIDAIDAIADLYFFNLVGNLAFMDDRVARFVHDRLQMRNWTGQPMFEVRDSEFVNASNNYVLRPKIWGEQVRPFVYFGLHYFGGASFRVSDGSAVSLGAGLAAKDPLREGNGLDDNLRKIQPSGGIFWDRADRLMASVIFNGTDDLLVRANLYPELFDRPWFDVGFFLGLQDDAVPAFGISLRRIFAVGFR